MDQIWADIADTYKALGITWINAADVSDLQITEDVREVWKTVCEYKGFDVVEMLRQLKKMNDLFNLQHPNPGVINLTPEVSFDKAANLFTDAGMMIFIFAARGSKLVKMKVKSSEQLVELIEHFELKYGLEGNVDPAGNPKVVTLPRVAACFPTVLLDFYDKNYGKPLITQEQLGIADPITNALCCTSLPCILPAKTPTRVHHLAFLASVLVDNVIKSRSRVTELSKMASYYVATYSTKATSQKVRNLALGKLGLKAGGNWSRGLLIAGDAAWDRIAIARPGDTTINAARAIIDALGE